MKRKKLGEILQDRGKISAESLQQLFKEQEGNKVVRLGELILERGLVDKLSLVKALEEVSRVPYLDCTTMQCEEEVLKTIPKPMAVRLDILPVRMEEGRLLVVMAEPQNVATIDELRFTCGKDINARFGFRAEILSAIVRNYDHFVAGAAPRSTGLKVPQESGGEIEFISTSSRQANREAIQEVRAELDPPKNARGAPGVGNDSEGYGQAGQRHPHRAADHANHGASARGRRLAGTGNRPAEPPSAAGIADQDSLGHGYCRAPSAAGWALHGGGGVAPRGYARFHAAYAIRRKGGHAAAGGLGADL